MSKFVLPIIVRFRLRILETNKSEKRAHRLVHSSSGKIVSVELECSKFSTVRHFCFGSTDSGSRSRMNSLPDSLISQFAVQQDLRYATRSDSSFVDFQTHSRRRLSRFADFAAGERNFVIDLVPTTSDFQWGNLVQFLRHDLLYLLSESIYSR